MSTKTNKRVENRGYGRIQQKGEGRSRKYLQIDERRLQKPLLFVEREPDNLLAAAILCNVCLGDFTIQFTDRHSINYDVTKYPLEIEHDGILILCPSINEYSVFFLERLEVPYYYVGSTTKLEAKYVNPHTYLTKSPVSSLIAAYFGIHSTYMRDAYIAEISAYTTRYIPDSFQLFDVIKYQYLIFQLPAPEMFSMLLCALKQHVLVLPEELQSRLEQLHSQQLAVCSSVMDNAVVIERDGLKYAFIQGGCPCTLVLNYCLRNNDYDVCINVCTHRQHFTALTRDNIAPVYEANLQQFLYSGCGEHSAGGCFEKDATLDRFVDAFFEHKRLHGFYNDRLQDYTTFEPEEYEWLGEEHMLAGRKIYKNFNFTIFLDNYCNADCRFCIEQMKTANSGRIEKAKIQDEQVYLERLDEILRMIRPWNPSVSITGGEPLLSPCFGEVMKLLAKYKFRKTVITTNGTGIWKHLDEIIAAGISHVNFSRPSIDEAAVQNLMRFHSDADIIAYAQFPEIIRRLEAHNVRTRFNCIMSRNGVASLEDMKRYMDFIASLGCHYVVFRELMSFDENTALNREKKEYADANRVPVNRIWKQIDEDEEFVPITNMQGHYYYIEIYEYLHPTERDKRGIRAKRQEPVVMVSERANLAMLESSLIQNDKYIYEMVFHPNGNLCAGWAENEDVLDAFDKGEKVQEESYDEQEFLKAYDSNIYEKPSVAVDLLIFTIYDKKLKIYLTERTQMPQRGKLALPGVIVGVKEPLEKAVERCLSEKAQLKDIYFEQLYTWGDVDRDPRLRMISVSYIALVSFDVLSSNASMDITGRMYDVDALQSLSGQLAFDHEQMIRCGRERIRNKTEYTQIAFQFLPEEFTLPQLQQAYEILLGKKLYKANFRKKIMPFVTETGKYTSGDSHRPSMLYQRSCDCT